MRGLNLGSSHGGVAVSNAGGRGFDTFRACAISRAGHPVPDTCTLTTAQTLVIGVAVARLHDLRVTPDWWGTGLLPRNRLGSRPRARTARAVRRGCPAAVAQQESAGPSRRRSRVRIPSVAPMHASNVDVAEWTRHRLTKPVHAGSTPAVDTNLAVAQRTEHRAPNAEAARSTRAGETA